MKEPLVILFFAFILDLALGDPVYRLHPVRLIGELIHSVESLLERLNLLDLRGGVMLVIIVQVVVLGSYTVISTLLSGAAVFFQLYLFYSCISLKDLVKHGKAVLSELEGDNLEQARNAVQMLIGRDAHVLDRHGVARATVESLAENFIDGFLSPLFWFAIGSVSAFKLGISPVFGGTASVLFFKVASTLDSMVGYKNERYLLFGRAGARLDDILNYLPARLGIPLITFSAVLTRLNGKNAWKTGWRDRLKHSSPNAGHAEACVAGALNIRLNGPGIYPHGRVEKPWLGNGTELVEPAHISQASYLILTTAFLSVALFVFLMEIS